MTRRGKIIRLLAALIGLGGPYFVFALYFLQQYPSNNEPEWLTTTLLVWFTANFLILIWIVRRLSSVPSASTDKSVTPPATPDLKSGLIVWMGWLLLIWSVLFIYGFVETVNGQIPLRRALIAGTFLLFFIGLFVRAFYGMLHEDKSNP